MPAAGVTTGAEAVPRNLSVGGLGVSQDGALGGQSCSCWQHLDELLSVASAMPGQAAILR
jgi:hypothetical protein